MSNQPSTTGGNGRGPRGRFGPGNKIAKGNPHAVRVAKLRTAALSAIKPKELAAVIRKLLELALAGDVAAAREVFQRTLGPAVELDLLERLEALEQTILESEENHGTR